MAHWKINKDLINDGLDNNVSSIGADKIDPARFTEKFRMYDDDGELYYEGVSTDSNSQGAFDPLDDFGQGNAGCVRIDYFNRENKRWEML